MSLVIRKARSDEYAEIDRLIADAYAHDYGPGDSDGDPVRSAEVRARDYDLWVAVEGDALLGSVTTRRPGGPALHEDFGDDELDLRLLGVSPDARRRGIAASLMRFVVDRARAQGFRAVILKTHPDMGGAHRLYDRLGFVRAPERDGLWIGGRRVLDLLTYAYPLADGDRTHGNSQTGRS
ncbi:GNAT family N-acetyltransferase [Leucobacter weissii]|uniref:GNAT family N-acetyltransferase n=1 Tax=Leucobacter weissii TaxID=1983706 RepID=A0A939MKJ7_9MICO|nr:GNAT family N-acetyltransferase [Leucobacter weissii]MBO1900527.1 GNAT family N-acetyltransferase [Leucobacter weissii]